MKKYQAQAQANYDPESAKILPPLSSTLKSRLADSTTGPFVLLFIATESAPQLANFVTCPFCSSVPLTVSKVSMAFPAFNTKERAVDGGFYQVHGPQAQP
jgi:hypothetical protein